MSTERRRNPIESGTGKQMDDNIDDLGRRPDGTTQDQPGTGRLDDKTVEAERDVEDTEDHPNPSPMHPAFP
ncbi:MAG: hypothetical protein ACTHLT_17825 [Devosia sp.]